jgi:hypothetical protein
MQLFKTYSWKEGSPIGLQIATEDSPITYKIVKDPYRKRISLEKYQNGNYLCTVYDSGLFDFRKLNKPEQKVWQKEDGESTSLIRDEDDRVILKERYVFVENFCREVLLFSPQDILVGRQKMFYSKLNDPFDGAILYDLEGEVVLWKRYHTDEACHWTNVIAQGWGKIGEAFTSPQSTILQQ